MVQQWPFQWWQRFSSRFRAMASSFPSSTTSWGLASYFHEKWNWPGVCSLAAFLGGLACASSILMLSSVRGHLLFCARQNVHGGFPSSERSEAHAHFRHHQDRWGHRSEDHRSRVGRGSPNRPGEARRPRCRDQVPRSRSALWCRWLHPTRPHGTARIRRNDESWSSTGLEQVLLGTREVHISIMDWAVDAGFYGVGLFAGRGHWAVQHHVVGAFLAWARGCHCDGGQQCSHDACRRNLDVKCQTHNNTGRLLPRRVECGRH